MYMRKSLTHLEPVYLFGRSTRLLFHFWQEASSVKNNTHTHKSGDRVALMIPHCSRYCYSIMYYVITVGLSYDAYSFIA